MAVNVGQLLATGGDQLSERERRVVAWLAKRAQISRNVNQAFEEHRTFGDRLADRVATFGGSWTFISLFLVALVIWTAPNWLVLIRGLSDFDPYPYIFLNLILSMLAALQAPIIMMSQNRQTVSDHLAAGLDYEVNLKAEIEIMKLHEKLDQIRSMRRGAATRAAGATKASFAADRNEKRTQLTHRGSIKKLGFQASR